MNALPNRIKELREAAGLTQTDLARAIGTGRSTVAKLEAGEVPLSDKWMWRIARVLNCAGWQLVSDAPTLSQAQFELIDAVKHLNPSQLVMVQSLVRELARQAAAPGELPAPDPEG